MVDEAERKNMDPSERVARELSQVPMTDEQRLLVADVRAEYVRLADFLLARVAHNPTLTVALRNLVASKDDAVRAVIFP